MRVHITKNILAMANIPDGGAIVIGVEQEGEAFPPTGLQPPDRDSFTQDGVSSHVNEFADPFVEVAVSKVSHEGSDFIVIQVEGFMELPVICKKDGPGGLRRGAVYTRPRRRHEAAEVPSQVEMREILDRAVEKGTRVLHARIGRAGLEVIEPEEADRRSFNEQLRDL